MDDLCVTLFFYFIIIFNKFFLERLNYLFLFFLGGILFFFPNVIGEQLKLGGEQISFFFGPTLTDL